MKNKKDLIKLIVLLTLISFVCIFIGKHWHHIKHINIKNLTHFLRRKGKYAAIIFLVIYALKPLILILPSSAFSLVGGVLLGPVKGFICNMLGFWLSGSVAFVLSRVLGKSFVENLLKDKAVKLGKNIEKNGFKIIFLLRFPPIFPYDPISYASGLTKMKYKDFAVGSLLGVIPETMCYSYIGENVTHSFNFKIMVPIILIIVTTIIGMYMYKKSKISNVVEK